MLNAYPLCLEWMDFNAREPDRKGQYCIIIIIELHVVDNCTLYMHR